MFQAEDIKLAVLSVSLAAALVVNPGSASAEIIYFEDEAGSVLLDEDAGVMVIEDDEGFTYFDEALDEDEFFPAFINPGDEGLILIDDQGVTYADSFGNVYLLD